MKQREAIERLMTFSKSVFGEQQKANMRRLLDSLGCNLEPLRPVQFDWDPADMEYLYGKGEYVARAPEPAADNYDEPNLFDDEHVLHAIQAARPDGIRNPADFQQAIEDGEINLQLVENVRSCILVVGQFYLQRPPTLDTPFSLVKVVKIHLEDDGKTQWGAWVHPWEISTTGDNVDYFKDPWHASADHKASQRYNDKLPMNQQTAAWTYPLSVLSEFQDEVPMNKKWVKPR
jgi:hypothetical protein